MSSSRALATVSTSRRLTKRIVLSAVIIYVVLSIAAGVRLADTTFNPVRREMPPEIAAHPEKSIVGPYGAREVRLRAGDGVDLGAWYVRPATDHGNAVVLLHGLSDNRLGSAGLAPLFLRHGYRVLL